MLPFHFDSRSGPWRQLALRERLDLVRYIRATYCGRVVRDYNLRAVGAALDRLSPDEQRAVIAHVRAVA